MAISLPVDADPTARPRSGQGLTAKLALGLLAVVGLALVLICALGPARDAAPPSGQDRHAPTAGSKASSPPAPGAYGLRSQPQGPAPVLRFLPLSPAQAFLKNAAIPDSKIPDTPARPFYLASAAPDDAGQAGRCLAQAVYYEAASESLDGQRAVAQVVLNRVRDARFPKTVCGVVFQGSQLRTGCQFSFTCDGAMGRPPSPAGWLRAQAVADAALDGGVMKAVGHATHYHTVWVTPYWGPSLVKWGRLGAHIFYRWTGGGAPVALGARPSPEIATAATAKPVATRPPEPAPAIADAPVAASTAKIASIPPAAFARPWPSAWAAAPPADVTASPVTPPQVSYVPYQATRPGPGLDSPHFASRGPA